jgi:hypothetical protein
MRRAYSQNPCPGCHRPACARVFANPADLSKHRSRPVAAHACPWCRAHHRCNGDMLTHFDRAHGVGWRALYKLQPRRRSPITMPSRYRGGCTRAQYIFVVRFIARNVTRDLTKRWDVPTALLLRYMRNRRVQHELAQELMDHLLSRKLIRRDDGSPYAGCFDVNGGWLPGGYALRGQGGLFMLSPDRKCNTQPHWLPGWSVFHNVRLACLAMNHNTNPIAHYGRELCCALRSQAQRVVCPEERAALFALETSAKGALRCACSNIFYRKKNKRSKRFKDPQCRACFGTLENFFVWMCQVLQWSQGRCQISNIPMYGKGVVGRQRMYLLSVDAILPERGHVKGNLRLVCWFLNSCNTSSRQKYVAKDDASFPCAWTRSRFHAYIHGPDSSKAL